MAFEIPTSLIRQVQIALREEAGLSSYDPDDPSLPNLPSIEESLAEFDPSPPYLRCKQCRGRLIRDLQSIVCIYCGAQQRKELPPEPLPFKTTFGYRWLLESLDLDGSETVDLSSGVNGSTKSQNVSKEELVLSDLLDIKLHWLAEPEKIESSFTNKAPIQIKSSLNFAGVDFDYFFSETKNEAVPSGSKEDLVSNEQINKEMQTFPGQGSLNLFENVQSSDNAPRPVTTVDDGDPFSDWTAEFQSASSGTFPGDSKFDPFLGSSTINATSAMEAAFVPEEDVNFKIDGSDNDVKLKNDSVPLASKSDDWVQGNMWDTSSTKISGKTEQFEMKNDTNHVEPKTNSKNLSSSGDNWFQDDLWQNSGMKVAESERIDEDDDSSDAWHDFTSLGNVPDPFSNPSKVTGSATTNSVAQASETSMVGLSDFNEMDFFSLSGASSLKNLSTEVNDMKLEASVSDRMVEMDVQTGAVAKKGGSVDGSPTTTMQSEAADPNVERLINEMPDLSFMLEKDLKIPPK
ncbi:uncharacterized protein LOC122659811 [Telopea speciosissima]|uniref:uncharacterized protein LOC122659811 n=1 Tax=Telopea speciosissima TaxID=54955 RepID=UPI001CC6D354|nr:uncharacterized protein LOC122659811 [Telopea speciosissima]